MIPRNIKIGALVIALACLLAAPALAAAPQGTFTLSISGDVGTLDPNAQGKGNMAFVHYYVYQGLAFPSGLNYKTMPLLAESWELVDPVTYKFNLRRGVRFHGGEELTSQDVKYSLERQMGLIDPTFRGSAAKELKEMIKAIETPDKYTVIVRLNGPDVTFLQNMRSGTTYIVPMSYVQKIGDSEFNKHPNGTGPFKFKERKISEYLSFEAFPEYWNQNPAPGTHGPAQIAALMMRIIPNQQTAVAALQAGEVDGVTDVSPTQARELEKDQRLSVQYQVLNKPSFFFMNSVSPKRFRSEEPNPYYNQKVRQAMNMALDLDTLMKSYGTGHEYRTTLIGKGSVGYNPDVPMYNYEPEKARALLKQAGYEKGFASQIYTLADKPEYLDACVQYWRRIGVDLKYKIMTAPMALRLMYRKAVDGVMPWGGGQGYDTTVALFKLYVHSNGSFSMHTENKKVDELIDAQFAEYDQAKREAMIHQIITTIWEEAWFIPLWESPTIKVLRADRWNYEEWPTATRAFVFPNISPK